MASLLAHCCTWCLCCQMLMALQYLRLFPLPVPIACSHCLFPLPVPIAFQSSQPGCCLISPNWQGCPLGAALMRLIARVSLSVPVAAPFVAHVPPFDCAAAPSGKGPFEVGSKEVTCALILWGQIQRFPEKMSQPCISFIQVCPCRCFSHPAIGHAVCGQLAVQCRLFLYRTSLRQS